MNHRCPSLLEDPVVAKMQTGTNSLFILKRQCFSHNKCRVRKICSQKSQVHVHVCTEILKICKIHNPIMRQLKELFFQLKYETAPLLLSAFFTPIHVSVHIECALRVCSPLQCLVFSNP